MKDCFSTLQTVARSTEDLLADHLNSLESTEIKHSAGVLRSSIQPCLEEIKRSTLLLKTHLEACIENLDTAEDLWHSKQRIVEIPTVQILEAIGKMVGTWNRFQQLSHQLQQELIKQAQEIWFKQIQQLEDQVFLDAKTKQYQSSIGWGDKKDRFSKELPSVFNSVAESINKSSKEIFIQAHQYQNWNYFQNDLNFVQSFSEKIDRAAHLKFSTEYGCFRKEVCEQFNQLTSYPFRLSLYQSVQETLEKWQKPFGNILHQDVKDFKQRISNQIEERVSARMSDCLKVIQKLVEYTIEFYHNLLTRQNRYRQETPQQQKAEQAWITQQRKHLKRLLADLEEVSRDR